MIGGGDPDERTTRGDFGDASTRRCAAPVFTDFRVVQRAIDMEMKGLFRRRDLQQSANGVPAFYP
jgi:hypothetical protein